MILSLGAHPVVVKTAEEMARDHHEARSAAGTVERGCLLDKWEDCAAGYRVSMIRTHLYLLLDLSLSATRDWWVRWGVDTWRERTCNEYFDANVPFKWHTLRDNPEGLHAAILKEIAAARPL